MQKRTQNKGYFFRILRGVLLITLLFCCVMNTKGISYLFSASSGAFTPNASSTTIHAAGVDDALSAAINIGFTFKFGGCTTTNYTQVMVSSNGWMTLGSGATGNQATNSMSWEVYGPLLAPLWDDLKVGTGGSVNYILTGSAGNRVFTVEWLNMKWYYSAASNVISFQVKLYEQNGKIEFIYRQESGSVTSGSASIGINGGVTGDYYSLNNSGTSPSAVYGTATNNINTKPATGQVYTWELPTTMTYVSCAATQASIADTYQGYNNQEILCLPIVISGGCTPFDLTQISINMTGTTSIADVTNIDVYYTGTTPSFAASTLFGSVVPGAGILLINGTQTLQNGTNYFWIVYDLSSTAVIGDVLDAQCTQITMTFPGGTHTPTMSDPAGSRPIVVAPASFSKWIEMGWARSVIESSDGKIVWAGLTNNSYSSGSSDAYIVKASTDLSTIEWTAVIGTASSSDYIEDIAETADGYVAVGYSNMAGGPAGYNIMVTKVSLTGVHQWTRLIGTASTDYGYGITKTSDGNIAVCGYEGSSSDGYFAKINNSTGVIMAEKTINSTGTLYLYDIIQTSDGGFLIVGKANGGDFYMVKLKSDYTLDWGRRWDGGSTDELKFVTENAANDYTVAGSTSSYGAGSSDGYVMRFTWNGSSPNVAWVETIGSASRNTFNDGYRIADGYIFTGITTRLGDDLNDEAFISRISLTGSNVFMKSIGTTNAGEDEEGYGISPLSDGSILVAGLHNSGAANFYMVKMSGGGFSCATVQDNGGITTLVAPSFSTDGSVSSPFGFSSGTPAPILNAGGVIAPDGCLILPVEMLYFMGVHKPEGNLLTWATASESNNKSFIVERSQDMINWTVIGAVAGAGNSSVVNEYSFTDTEEYSGIVYYRIRQNDFDGQVSYSRIIHIDSDGHDFSMDDIQIYPNPSSGIFSVLYSAPLTDCQVEVFNLAGQKMTDSYISESENMSEIDIRNLADGVYLLKVSCKEGVVCQRIIKSNQ